MSSINWNASIRFPSDSCFVNRILSAKFGLSNAGNQMITLESEVVSPETYMVGEQEVNIAGVKVKSYYTTKVFNKDGSVDEEKTQKARNSVFGPSGNPEQPSLFERLELNPADFDPENPDVKQLEGICFCSQMSSSEDEQRRTPTAEQIAKAKESRTKALGDVMRHPKTGLPLVKYWPRIDDIFCKAEGQQAGGKPF